MPVHFVPLSPDRVKRTSAFEGLRALTTLVTQRFLRRRMTLRRLPPISPSRLRSSVR